MAKRELSEINAGSMADIAFLLLIFFLVTTTMDVDSGLPRKLPPFVDQTEDDKTPPIKERNVFVVLINMNNNLLVEGKPCRVEELCDKVKEFVDNPKDNENLSEKKPKFVPFFGEYPISKGVVSLQNDNSTEYGMYIKVQNELVRAYQELKDNLARRKFGKTFDDLNEQQQDAIKEIFPQAISEAEPKNVGGK